MIEVLENVGPMLAGILTVPILGWIKSWLAILDRAPAWVKQFSALGIAIGLTFLGQWLQVQLPIDLALFTESDVEALIAAAIAMGVHAGKKAREPLGPGPSALLLAALLLPTPASAQAAPDSVVVTIVDRGAPGDTVTFEAIVVDTLSVDLHRGRIGRPADERRHRVPGRLRGRHYDGLDVLEVVGLVFMLQEDDGTWSELVNEERALRTGLTPDTLNLDVGDQARLCAFAEWQDGRVTDPIEPVYWRSSDESIVTITSEGPNTCPPWRGITGTLDIGQLLEFQRRGVRVG